MHQQFESILHPICRIIRNEPQYCDLLPLARTDGRWGVWTVFLVAAVGETVEVTRIKVPRTTYAKELTELLFVEPSVKIEHVVAAGLAG